MGTGVDSSDGVFATWAGIRTCFTPMIDFWEDFRPEKVVNTSEPKLRLKTRTMDFLYRVRRRIATALAVLLAIVFGYHVMVGHNGLNAYEQKRAEDRELHQQIDSLQQENDRLKEHVEHLKSDPDAIEREARERLHYARPGEVIYTLNGPQTATQSQPPAGAVNK
jgi:cell division protein FtsB